MKKISLLFLGLSLLVPLSAITVDELLYNFDRSLNVPSIQGEFHVTLISQKGDEREIKARIYQKKVDDNQENRLFLFDFPATVRGTGLLLHSYFDERDNSMWIYLPAVKRIKRIALESSGGGYFMGSDFTYRDLVSNDRKDMEFEILEETVMDGVDCYVIKSQGKTDLIRQDMGYSSTISYHRKDNFMLHRREFYDLSGDLEKIYRAEGFLDLSPAIYPTDISMTNVQTGHKSVIKILDASTEEIPDRIFTTRYLEGKR
ncbi:MAG: outer membrane lipoprotein-sorting protein [Spirochaetales bacterium]|nr:outer membrane lipoprotein-sorting protein [Spirochaetales bacterium]